MRELASALTHRISRQPAHFDCIVRELRDSTEIAPQEKLCYLGAGTFGILEFRPPGGPSKFVIKKRIQYEEKELPQEWKKPLQIVLLKTTITRSTVRDNRSGLLRAKKPCRKTRITAC